MSSSTRNDQKLEGLQGTSSKILHPDNSELSQDNDDSQVQKEVKLPEDVPHKLDKKAQEEAEDKLQKEMEEKEIERLSKPFFLAKMFVRFPWIVIVICWLIISVFLAITGIFGLFEMTDFGERDYLVWGDYRVKRRDRMVLAHEDLDKALAGETQPQRSTSPDEWFTNLFYTCSDCDNLFTTENIVKIYQAEIKLQKNEDYSIFCKVRPTGQAITPQTLNSECDEEDTGYLSVTQDTDI